MHEFEHNLLSRPARRIVALSEVKPSATLRARRGPGRVRPWAILRGLARGEDDVLYLKAPNRGPLECRPQHAWGTFTRYMEIGDDEYGLRHVDRYANGYCLRYDRTHWVDGFGLLIDMRYDVHEWARWWQAGITIDPAEFEAAWHAAESSPTRRKQLRTARMHGCGAVPIWLADRPQAT